MRLPRNLQLAIGRFLLWTASSIFVYWAATFSAFYRADAQYKAHVQRIQLTDPQFQHLADHADTVRQVLTWNLNVDKTVSNQLLPYLAAAIVCFLFGLLFYVPAIARKPS